jgi:HAD superfamily hydrolase (TIGR01549 family)
MIQAIFFDVANTLLHKPAVFVTIKNILADHGHAVDLGILQKSHKLLSERITFPDKTSREFYSVFNNELLNSLGIAPSQQLINEIYEKCSYLPWETFADAAIINNLNLPLGVISNWDNSLKTKLDQFFSVEFKWILGSESIGFRKPSMEFYSKILEFSGLPAQQILYVGDSIQLDIEPALQLGIQALLIDRIGIYSSDTFPVIKDLNEISTYL